MDDIRKHMDLINEATVGKDTILYTVAFDWVRFNEDFYISGSGSYGDEVVLLTVKPHKVDKAKKKIAMMIQQEYGEMVDYEFTVTDVDEYINVNRMQLDRFEFNP